MAAIPKPRFWHQYYPENLPTSLQYEPTTIPQALHRSAQRFADRASLVFYGFPMSFSALDAQVNRFADVLASLGVQKGERVAILLPNIPQFVVCNYGILRYGAVGVMANPLYTERELEHLLNDAGAQTLIALDILAPRVQAILPKTKLKRVIFTHLNDLIPLPEAMIPPGFFAPVPEQEGVFAFKDMMEKASEAPFPDQSQWDALALLIYTGGTTGVSKGVMLTHANLSCTVQQTLAFFSNVFKPGEDVAPAIYPFFHVGGHSVVQNTFIWNGATLHLIPRPEAKSLAQLLSQHRFTVFQAVPTLFVGLLQEPAFQEADLSSIKIFGTGAAPMSGATYLALKELAPQVMVTEGYGMTETGGLITSTPATARFKQGSVGLPLPDTEVRIVDLETGTQEMPLGQAGEVVVKGPQVMAGYYQRPDQTQEVFREGWLHTGDIGYLDEEGWLFLIDRKKDMILASGYNIYPKEIDEVLYTHPDILEACTVGIPDEYRGETVKVFIVRKSGSNLQAEEVEAFCREKLAAYKVPRLVEFVAELPKSAVGKILRRALRPEAPKG